MRNDIKTLQNSYRFYKWLIATHGVVEVRGINIDRGTFVGYFDDAKSIVTMLGIENPRKNLKYLTVPRDGEAFWYYILGLFPPDLRARSYNKISRSKISVSDSEVTAYKLILVDCDPIRPRGVSSSQHEKHLAACTARRVYRHLTKILGIPKSALIFADSGNGFHILINTVAFPNNADNVLFVRSFLNYLGKLFSTAAVGIDQTVYNPSRISKLYGSLSIKGSHVSDRPWRYSNVHFYNDKKPITCYNYSPTEVDLLSLSIPIIALPATLQGDGGISQERNITAIVDMLEGEKRVFRRKDRPVHSAPFNDAIFEFESCPVHEKMTDDNGPDGDQYECMVGVETSGKIFAKCQHMSDKTWQDFKTILHYEKYVKSYIPDTVDDINLHFNTSTGPASSDSTSTSIQNILSTYKVDDVEIFKDGKEVFVNLMSQFNKKEWKERPYAIPKANLLQVGAVNSIAGPPGVGKTTVLIGGIILPMLRGEPVLGQFKMPKIRIFYVNGDNDQSYFMNRLVLRYGYDYDRDFEWLKFFHTQNSPLPESQIYDLIIRAIEYFGSQWIIIDNRTSIFVESVYGMDSSKKALKLVDNLKGIAIKHGVIMSMVEHMRKNFYRRPWELLSLDEVLGTTSRTIEQVIGINPKYDLIKNTSNVSDKPEDSSKRKPKSKETFIQRKGEGILLDLKNAEGLGSDLMQYKIIHEEASSFISFDKCTGVYQEIESMNDGIELVDSPISSSILTYLREHYKFGQSEFQYGNIAQDTSIPLSKIKKFFVNYGIDFGMTILDIQGRGQKARVKIHNADLLNRKKPELNLDKMLELV